MRHFHLMKNRKFRNTINVNQLWSLLGDDVLEQAKSESGGKAPILDLSKHGVGKVLGKGRLPDLPIVVKARFFSKKAEMKIKKSGGACLLTG